MIDRKSLWIFIVVFLATIGATFWQLSLLPDLRHIPFRGLGRHTSVSVLVAFAIPASLLLFWLTPFIQWLALPKETRPSQRRWNGTWIVSMSVCMAMLQAVSLTYSLGNMARV